MPYTSERGPFPLPFDHVSGWVFVERLVSCDILATEQWEKDIENDEEERVRVARLYKLTHTRKDHLTVSNR